MNKDWLELESDPGLFTLLVEDFGVEGIQVEEIYDLQKKFESPVYGFIFLFKWIEERRSRRKQIQDDDQFVTDEDVLNDMFFAQQVIPNSCATHSLLSVLLNCDNVKLGETLTKLKEFSKHMSPEDKGLAIGNIPELAKAHMSHARPQPSLLREQKQQGIPGRTMEAFHFASYVPVNGRLFELDGLKPYPIDHGPWEPSEDWTELFRTVITERLGMATGGEPYHDIRYNLMAVVPDKRQIYEQKLKTLKTNRQIVLETLQKMVDVTDSKKIITRSSETKTSQTLPSVSPPKTRQKTKSALATQSASAPVTPACASATSTPLSRSATQSPVIHAAYALDSHNYAKSPILEFERTSSVNKTNKTEEKMADSDSDVEIIDVTEGKGESSNVMEVEDVHLKDRYSTNSLESNSVDISRLEKSDLKSDKNVKICITVADDHNKFVVPSTVSNTDVTKPLSIQTKFAGSPGPSSNGTDTTSELGSSLSSPVRPATSQLSSPTTQQLSMAAQKLKSEEVGTESSGQEIKSDIADDGKVSGLKDRDTKTKAKHPAFTPKDLLQLLKNVEQEIGICEQHLKDENEKRKKYRIDDCRRTHNYDQFICTFLTMLAEQGQLAGLVQKNMLVKIRQGVNVGKLHKTGSRTNSRKRSKSTRKR